MAGGALDQVVAKIEAYIGEFLGTRQQLLDAKGKIDSALVTARASGTAMIGGKPFTYTQLASLSQENSQLLARNADLHQQIMDFKDKVAAVQAGAESVMDTLVTETDPNYPWYDVPGMLGSDLGILPVAVPATVLVATGAALAAGIYFFLSSTKDHLASVAGEVGSNLIVYGGIALLGVWYLRKRGIL